MAASTDPSPRRRTRARCPFLRSRPQLSKINGSDVLGDAYELVIAKLKAAPRPLCLHFLGPLPPLPEEAEGAATAGKGAGAGAGAAPPASHPQQQQQQHALHAEPTVVPLSAFTGGGSSGSGGAAQPAVAPPSAAPQNYFAAPASAPTTASAGATSAALAGIL